MSTIQNIIKKFDIFGMTFTFRYKNTDKYQTVLGGLIVILFIILVSIVGIYYFIPFAKRKNYTIVYYTMNLSATEEVNLFQSESNFALGLKCEDNSNEKYNINDLLSIKAKYTSFHKYSDGSSKKNTSDLETHKCTYEDFYNKYNKQFDYMELSIYECLDEKKDTIQGIYADEIFSYFEFTITAKDDSALNELDRFLFENDCKLEFIYTDIIIDLDNYKKAQTQYLNEIFIQLSPIYYIKRNIYFMNQYFYNDNYILFVFEGKGKGEIKPLYSRYEDYSMYKGLERINNKIDNYEKYAKIFIRADIKKTIINRRYQKFMEFYADASSLLIALYEILVIIFNYIDDFYAHHSLSKQLFFFKGIEDSNNYNIFKKRIQIRRLISFIENNRKKVNINSNLSDTNINRKIIKEDKLIKKDNIKEFNIIENFDEIQRDNINIQYNENKIKKANKDVQKKIYINKNILTVKLKNSKTPIYKNKKNDLYNHTLNKRYIDSEGNSKNNQLSYKNNDIIENFSDTNKFSLNPLKISDSMNIQKDELILPFSSSRNNNIFNEKKIENSFNIFEIIAIEFFSRCLICKDVHIKNQLNENANKIIYKKLDIITYIRNMILFDIINEILLDNKKKDIINFLCRPVISANKSSTNEYYDFYKLYGEKDFDKFMYKVEGLVKKKNKDIIEEKLIELSKEQLKEFV